MDERIETVRQISAENLKAGGFAFKLPDTASEEERKEFNTTLEEAKNNNFNLVLRPDVQVIDLTVKTPEPVIEKKEDPATVAEPVKEVPKVEEKPVETKPVEQPVQQPTYQQPLYYAPQPGYGYGQVPYAYNPFVQQPMAQTPQPAPEQPKAPAYNPSQMVPIHDFNVQPMQNGMVPQYPYVFPMYGVAPPRPQTEKQQ